MAFVLGAIPEVIFQLTFLGAILLAGPLVIFLVSQQGS